MAVRVVRITEKVVGIYSLLDPGVDHVAGRVGKDQGPHLDCVAIVIRNGWVTLRES